MTDFNLQTGIHYIKWCFRTYKVALYDCSSGTLQSVNWCFMTCKVVLKKTCLSYV